MQFSPHETKIWDDRFRSESNTVVRSVWEQNESTRYGKPESFLFLTIVTPVHLNDVLLVPGCTENLFLSSGWDRAGNGYTGRDEMIRMLDGKIVF